MESNRLIELSVIIPTYNRKNALKECILSLLNQDYPQEKYEIIVVDDGSYDGTQATVSALSEGCPNLICLSVPHRGPAAARNTGIAHSQGAIIALTDNDCIPSGDWIKNIIRAHKRDKDILAIGGLTEVNFHNIKAAVSQFLSDGAMSTQVDNKLERIFFPTCNVSFKKQHLKERFNELFPLPAGEDLEFFWRIFKSGNKFLYDEGIRVFHNCHPDFKSFIRQAYKYGKGNFLVQYLHQDHPLLHEIKVSGFGHFALGCAVNFLKVPRFSYLLGRRLIRSNGKFNNYEKIQIYIYFALHKLVYLTGNIAEYFRVVSDKKLSRGEESKQQKKPEFIILDITHKCNLKCNICEIRKDGQIREFAIDEVKELIRQAMQWGVKEFVFSGGEPLVRKDIFEALDFVKANKYRVGLLTNGILLQGLLPRLSYYLSSNSLSLSISLDALTAEIHDDIRGKSGSFVTTISALKKLSELKKEQPNINFNVISIVLNTNLEELLPLANYLKTLEVNSIQFQPLLANNLIMRERSERVKYWIPQERYQVLDSTIDSLIEFKRSNPFLVRNSLHNLNLVKKYFRGELTSKDVKCSHISKTMLIANNGDVTTCFDCYGNVRKDSLVDIFNSQAARHSKRRAEECRRPCLLPCFTDWQE